MKPCQELSLRRGQGEYHEPQAGLKLNVSTFNYGITHLES